jgi:hypothetical protein
MKHHDCRECSAFVAEMKTALKDLLKQSECIRSREEVQQALARYLSLREAAVMRLRESFSLTKARQVYARFIGAPHPYHQNLSSVPLASRPS